MYGIEVAVSGTETTVAARGEFDAFSLPVLRAALDDACSRGGRVAVDLSGVTFLDLQFARELAVRSMIQGHLISFENPTPGVPASIKALGLGDGEPTTTDGSDREEPPVFSGA